jgi:hypothetical protein
LPPPCGALLDVPPLAFAPPLLSAPALPPPDTLPPDEDAPAPSPDAFAPVPPEQPQIASRSAAISGARRHRGQIIGSVVVAVSRDFRWIRCCQIIPIIDEF